MDMDIIPELRAECWCPAFFTPQKVSYINRVCAETFNRAVRNMGTQTPFSSVAPLDNPLAILPTTKAKPTNKSVKSIIEKVTKRKAYLNRADIFSCYLTIVQQVMPFGILVCALVLQLPDILWIVIGDTLLGLRIDRTLDTHNTAYFTSIVPNQRQKIFLGAAREIFTAVGSSGKCSTLFIAGKVMVCALSAGQLIVVTVILLPHLQDLHKIMSELLVISRLTPLINFLWSSCVVLVKKNEKVENVTVNCLHSLSSHGDGDRSTSCYTNLTPALATLNFYANLRYIYVFCSFLVLHNTFKIVSTASWMAKLCNKSCLPAYFSSGIPNRSGSGKTKPRFSTDILLFLFLAHERLGPIFAMGLVKSFREITRASTTTDLANENDEEKDERF